MTSDERQLERGAAGQTHGLMAHVRRRIEDQAALAAQLEAIDRRMGELGDAVRDLAARAGQGPDPSLPGELAALRDALAALEKGIGRAGREQLKANALAETQAEQIAAALDALRAADERRETQIAAQRERDQAALAEARLDVVRAMLPALDGIDEALRAGEQMLARHDERRATRDQDQPAPAPAHPPAGGMLRRVAARLRPNPAAPPAPGAADDPALRAALESWLVGLTFVRRRMLDALAAEGVAPIPAVGRPFDPRYHVAVQTVSSAPGVAPDSVAYEIRRGYLAGERVLRHAEVAVAAGASPDRPPRNGETA